MKTLALALAAGLMAAPAFGQAVNGEYRPFYGSAVAVQQVGTGFGDANVGDLQFANGSELNAAYYANDGTNLRLLLTGNLESNFNKLELFFDTGAAGGQSSVNGSGVGAMNNLTGFTFDTGFRANFWLSVTGGDIGGGVYGMFVDGAALSGTGATGGYLGTNDGQNGGALSGGANFLNALVAINNSNTSGVGGGPANVGSPLLSQTGIEIAIPWASLGVAPGSEMRVMAFINGQNHDYASNQFLGALPAGTGNLGGDGNGGFNGSVGQLNMNNFAGNQFFVIPTPGAAALLGLGGLAAFRRRRA